MYLALVYYPEIKHKGFHNFRNTYEPYAFLLPAHLTFIFPLEADFGRERLINHIETILARWKVFDMHFCTLEKTWDHWLFLGAKEGNKEAILLHDEFYTGPLASYLREDLPYTPHIGLGLFSSQDWDFHNPTAKLSLDKERFDKAWKEFEALEFELRFSVTELTLVRLNAEFTECENIHTFKLNVN